MTRLNSPLNADLVADAVPNSWVYRWLPRALWPYAQLARWERPIGWWLLMWPCWWAHALAQGRNGFTFYGGDAWFADSIALTAGIIIPLGLFMAGAILMRGAGCTYNDFVDVGIDEKVARTASRPIPSGRVSRFQAAIFTVLQALAGFAVLLALCALWYPQFNWFAFWLAIGSLGVVACYPFAKRITNWPQFVLGLAFSWGALMGWAVVFGQLSAAPLLLYAGSVLWTIGYDTIYAHQDREDDALVGVRSTARLFGQNTKPALILLYTGTLVLFAAAFATAEAGWIAYLGLIAGSGHMIWQIQTLDIDDADKCLKLFKSNSQFGWIVFAGLFLEIFL